MAYLDRSVMQHLWNDLLAKGFANECGQICVVFSILVLKNELCFKKLKQTTLH